MTMTTKEHAIDGGSLFALNILLLESFFTPDSFLLIFFKTTLGPGSLPGYARRRIGPGGEYDDGASDISSTSGFSAYGYRSGICYYFFIRLHLYLIK